MQLLSLLVLNSAAAAAAAVVPTYPLTGGGSIPALAMGGQNFTGWFAAASSPGNPAMIQTFHGYGNGAILAPQIAAAGRANVFVSTGIPCGCCGSDAAPGVMNASEANKLINDELAQLNVKYVDLLLFHHRCNTTEETAAVWSALEAAKAAGRAHHARGPGSGGGGVYKGSRMGGVGGADGAVAPLVAPLVLPLVLPLVVAANI
jgi:hypothetical protein